MMKLKNTENGPQFDRKYLLERVAEIEHFLGAGLLPNIEEILSRFGKGYKIYEDTYKNPHVFGLASRRKAGVLSMDWSLKIDDGNEDVRDAIYDALPTSLAYELFDHILDTPYYGFTPIEIMWAYEKSLNRYVPTNFHARPRDWFSFDTEDKMIFTGRGNDIECKPFKFLVPRISPTPLNPYGNSLLAKLFWNVEFIKNSKRTWAGYNDTYGVPWLLAQYPLAWEKEKIDDFMQSLKTMRSGGILVAPQKQSDLSLVEAHKGGVDNFIKLIDDCRKENAVLILGHESASQSSPGKLGAESNAETATEDIILSDKRLVENTMNRFIDIFCQINFPAGTERPEFYFERERELNEDLVKRDVELSKVGVRYSKAYMMREYGFLEEDIEIVDPAAQSATPPELPPKEQKDLKKKSDMMMSRGDIYMLEDEHDEWVENYLNDEWDNKKLSDEISVLKKHVNDADGFEDAIKDYDKLWDDIKLSGFINELESAYTIAWLLGENAVQDEVESEDIKSTLNRGVMMAATIDEDDIKNLIKLKPEDIAKWFEEKGLKLSKNWRESLEVIREEMFTVSNITRLDILYDFKELLEENLKEGLSYSEFKKEFEERYAKKGWQSLAEQKENTLPPHRISLIYTQNTINAYQKGRWDRFDSTMDTHPYIQVRAKRDKRTSKICKALHLKVFRKDDVDYRMYHMSPRHFRCRSREVSISESKLKRRGLTVSKGSDFAEHKNDPGFIRDAQGNSTYQPDKKKYDNSLWERFKKSRKKK